MAEKADLMADIEKITEYVKSHTSTQHPRTFVFSENEMNTFFAQLSQIESEYFRQQKEVEALEENSRINSDIMQGQVRMIACLAEQNEKIRSGFVEGNLWPKKLTAENNAKALLSGGFGDVSWDDTKTLYQLIRHLVLSGAIYDS